MDLNQAPLQLGSASYLIGKLDAMSQFHITRRLLPILTELGISASRLAELSAEARDKELADVLGPVMDVVAKMSDEDVEYIIRKSLAVVKREQGDNRWAPVVARNGGFMFADIDMPTMIRLAVEVVRENMAGFFSGPPSAAKPD